MALTNRNAPIIFRNLFVRDLGEPGIISVVTLL